MRMRFADDRLFTMLVHDVGGALGGERTNAPHHIGLLDIFGFEIFDGARNGFEQMLSTCRAFDTPLASPSPLLVLLALH